MPRRLSREDYERLAARKSLKWRGPDVVHGGVKTEWECLACGKVWSTKYRTLFNGSGCPRCAGHERHPPEHFVELGKQKGYPWIGPEVSRVDEKTNWSCPKCEEAFLSTFFYIQQGHGCPKCGDRTLSPEKYRETGLLMDLDWLGEKVSTTGSTERWRCRKCGRTLRATYDSVKRGRRCSRCRPISFDLLPTPPAAYSKLAEANGLSWLGPPVVNTSQATQWRSEKCGHTFFRSYEQIQRSSNCRVCSKTRKKADQDYAVLGESRGIRCLNPNVVHSRVRTNWVCNKKKHVFPASYQEVTKLVGCPICGKKWRTYQPAKYKELAARFGNVDWVGPPAQDCASLTGWQCTRAQHRYQASYRQVKKRKGRCPICRATRGSAQPVVAIVATEAPPKLETLDERRQRVSRYWDEEREFMVQMRAHCLRNSLENLSWREMFRFLIAWGYTRDQSMQEEGISDEDEFNAAVSSLETDRRTGGPTWQQAFSVFKRLGYRRSRAERR